MMYQEFLNLTGLTQDDITEKTYTGVIEPMYMATEMDKASFISCLNLKAICDTHLSKNTAINRLKALASKAITSYSQEHEVTELCKYLEPIMHTAYIEPIYTCGGYKLSAIAIHGAFKKEYINFNTKISF